MVSGNKVEKQEPSRKMEEDGEMKDSEAGGGKSESQATAPNPTTLELAKVYSLLLSSFTENHLVQMVMEFKGDGAKAWRAVRKTYERKTTANRAASTTSFFTLKMFGGERIDALVARIRNLRAHLVSMGEEIPESLVRHVLLNALPDSYAGVVQTLQLQPSMEFDDVVSHLLDHEEREQMREANEDRRVESANYAGQRQVGGGRA